jgi:hypothetical protein
VVSGSALAQAPTITITEEIFHGRNAWVLQNGLIHVTVSRVDTSPRCASSPTIRRRV